MRRAMLGGAAMNVTGLRQVHGDARCDTAKRLAPADDAGNRFLVHAVLQRDDITVRRQILLDQHRRPRGVIGFHAHEGDIDRLLLGKLLGIGDVKGAHRHGEFRLLHRVGDAQAVLSHVLDMLRPRVDEGYVFAGLHHVGAGIAADRAASDKGDFFAHCFLPILATELATDVFNIAPWAPGQACTGRTCCRWNPNSG
jgi:hypothetical protein